MNDLRNITRVKGNCWKVTFFEKGRFREICFLCSSECTKKDLESKPLDEILKFPQIGDGEGKISYKQALVLIGSFVPSTFRQQKKLFRRFTDDPDLEEHF